MIFCKSGEQPFKAVLIMADDQTDDHTNISSVRSLFNGWVLLLTPNDVNVTAQVQPKLLTHRVTFANF